MEARSSNGEENEDEEEDNMEQNKNISEIIVIDD